MRIDKENNIIYFDNDEEFYDFCVETYSINRRVRDHRVRKAGWDFSDWYQSNVNEDTKIVILDSDSTILRRGGMVTGRAGITRKINAYRVNPVEPNAPELLIEVGERMVKINKKYLIMKNFFNAIGVADMERVHSAMIAWILDDENENTLSSTNPSQFTTFSKKERSCLLCELFGVGKKEFQSIKTHVEWYDIDILVETKDFDGNKEVWVIENKVKSNQHSNQLDKYVNIIKGNEKTKGKNPQALCTIYKGISDDKQHYCFLTLIEEKPQGTHRKLWHNCLYSNFYCLLKKQTLSGIVNEYADCLLELTDALKHFLDNYQDYKSVFSDGSKKKEDKNIVQIKNSNKGQYAPYIAEYGLETIFQKCFLAEIWKKYIGEKYIFHDKDWSISETNGTALLDIRLGEIILKSGDTHHVQIEFQNGTFKIQFYQIDERKDKFLKKWEKIFDGGKSYKDNNNNETWKVNYPKSNSNRSYISISKKIGNNWWKEDREKMLEQWCDYMQKCKNALDQIYMILKIKTNSNIIKLV